MTVVYRMLTAINTFAQVYGIVAHYKAVVFIQVEHGFFENKGRNFPQFKKHGGFRMVTKMLFTLNTEML